MKLQEYNEPINLHFDNVYFLRFFSKQKKTNSIGTTSGQAVGLNQQ